MVIKINSISKHQHKNPIIDKISTSIIKQPKHKYLYSKAVIIIAVILSFANSCITTYDTINNRNFADQYNPGNHQMHPEYSIYKKSDNDIRLYFRFFPRELAYMINEEDSIPHARASLFFRITNSYNSIEIIDSLTSSFNLKGKPRSHFLGYVPLKLPNEGKYIVEVFLTDNNVQQSVSTVIEYNHLSSNNSSSFMLLSQYGNPIFYSHFSTEDTFRVRSEAFNTKQMRVSYYKPDTILPLPPDIQKNNQIELAPIDTSWIVENPDTTLFHFNKEGIYYFSNSETINGKSFTCFNDHYPYVKTPNLLLKSLNYLCTYKEMEQLKLIKNEKQAVDTFWMQTTNDLDKSRELIRVYYNRVQLANYYFSNFKEGWLTDRGMIYIVCGAPNIIRKTDEGEYWVYGKSANESTNFFFYRDYHPLFGSILVLDRSDLYSRMWFNAVTSWRDGRVFSLNP